MHPLFITGRNKVITRSDWTARQERIKLANIAGPVETCPAANGNGRIRSSRVCRLQSDVMLRPISLERFVHSAASVPLGKCPHLKAGS